MRCLFVMGTYTDDDSVRQCARHTHEDNGLCFAHARVAQRKWTAEDWARHEENLAHELEYRLRKCGG